jgi:hypothetical protein
MCDFWRSSLVLHVTVRVCASVTDWAFVVGIQVNANLTPSLLPRRALAHVRR